MARLVVNATTDEAHQQNKGTKMNTNETTEATTVTEQVEPTPLELAHEAIKTFSLDGLADYIVRLEADKKAAIEAKQLLVTQRDAIRTELNNWKNSVGEFIKDHVKDDDISVDDLKEFADELNIELTKTIRVKFTIDVEGEFKVPLDFDEDDVSDETDFFTIKIDADPSDNDHEVYSEQWDVNNVEAEEV